MKQIKTKAALHRFEVYFEFKDGRKVSEKDFNPDKDLSENQKKYIADNFIKPCLKLNSGAEKEN